MFKVALVFFSIFLIHLSLPAFSQDAQSIRGDVSQTLAECFHCHGNHGISKTEGIPTLAGQKAEYLRRQLRNFKHTMQGAASHSTQDNFASFREKMPVRRDPRMSFVAVALTDDQIGLIADELSRMPCRLEEQKPFVSSKESVAPKVATRCFKCHEANGISTSVFIPNLAGQDETYLKKQIELFHLSSLGYDTLPTEPKRSHPIMQDQSLQLSKQNIVQVASYFSSLDCRG